MTAVPKLRFSKFSREWSVQTVGDLLERATDPVHVEADKEYREIGIRSHGRGVFYKPSTLGSALGNKRVFRVVPGTLVLNIVFAWEQAVALLGKEDIGLIASHRFPMFKPRERRCDVRFLKHLFLTKRGKWLLTLASPGGAGRNKTLGQQEFLKLKLTIPSPEEQSKVADVLDRADDKIDALRRKYADLKQFKAGLMQKLFSQELRFKRDDGSDYPAWEERRLRDVFSRVRRKNKENNLNVLTISGQQGLVNQEEYFNKSVAAKDVTGYYLIKRGEFAYNKSYSKGYPMGAIKRLSRYEAGVVSTLYICFSTDDEMLARYFEQYVDGGQLNRELSKIAQEGARNHGLLNISVVDFFDLVSVRLPHPDEQQKIADCLSALDAKIEAVDSQTTQMEAFKKGLLQKMFV